MTFIFDYIINFSMLKSLNTKCKINFNFLNEITASFIGFGFIVVNNVNNKPFIEKLNDAIFDVSRTNA